MARYILDGNNMTTLDALYDELELVLNLPDYCGRNLDALEECLAEIAEEEGSLTLVVKNAHVVEDALPEWESFVEVFLGNPFLSLSTE